MNEEDTISTADLCAHLASKDSFAKLLGIELVEASEGRSTMRMTVRDDHLNINGSCNGAVMFALADCAFGIACNSYGILATGIDVHMTFQAGAMPGDVLSATATEVSRSRRLSVYRIDVTRADGTYIAGFTGTAYITGKPNYSPPQG